MVVSTQPFFNDEAGGDKEAVIAGIEHMQAALANIEGLQWIQPAANQTAREYVESLLVTASARRSNHWMGTAKMGTDDGREADGTAVVDPDTKVWGTDNIFVVDASIFPGQLTGNPSASIVIAAERAAERMLALTPGSTGSSSSTPSTLSPGGGNSTTTATGGTYEASAPPKLCRRSTFHA